MRFRARFAATVTAASMVLLVPAAAHAQQVTGLEVRQDDGFATLGWQYARGRVVVRTSAGIAVGEGGGAPMIGVALGVRP